MQTAWIKLSAGDTGMTPIEATVLRAAARAACEVDATIGSHTSRGSVVHEQLNQVETYGHNPRRFIWIHASAEAVKRMVF